MKHFYLSLLVFLLGTKLFAQDVIYLTNNRTEPAVVTDIADDKIKYKTDNASSKTMKTQDLVLLFNVYGDYLVYYKGKRMFSPAEKQDFLLKPPAHNNDILFATDGTITPVKIIAQNKDSVKYISKGKESGIKTSALAVVIYKNGTHHLYSSAEQAVTVLPSKDMLTKYLGMSEEVAPPPPPPNKPVVAAQQPAEKKDTEAKPKDAAPKPPVVHFDAKLYQDRANQKIADFNDDINTIAKPHTPRDIVNKKINLACGLFINDRATIVVSNLIRRTQNSYKIREYLTRLAALSQSFDDIKITYAHIRYATDWVKGSDGNLHASVTLEQTYEGIRDGKVIYGDVTQRTINIILKPYQVASDSGYRTDYEVFLGDVGVTATEKLGAS